MRQRNTIATKCDLQPCHLYLLPEGRSSECKTSPPRISLGKFLTYFGRRRTPRRRSAICRFFATWAFRFRPLLGMIITWIPWQTLGRLLLQRFLTKKNVEDGHGGRTWNFSAQKCWQFGGEFLWRTWARGRRLDLEDHKICLRCFDLSLDSRFQSLRRRRHSDDSLIAATFLDDKCF